MICVMTAMRKEFELFADVVNNVCQKETNLVVGRIGAQNVCVVLSGIGKVNAALCLCEILRQYKISKVISVGCAGAAQAYLKMGDVVIGNSYTYHDVYCGEGQYGQVQGMPSVFPSDHVDVANVISDGELGMIASGDCFVDSREQVESILSKMPKAYNILALDMESAALAHVCYKKEIKFVSVRVISDNPLVENQQYQYENFWNVLSKKAFLSTIKFLRSL